MTETEVIKALAEGKKITQKDWAPGQFLTLSTKYIVDEDGTIFMEFLPSDGWILYKEPKKLYRAKVFTMSSWCGGQINWFESKEDALNAIDPTSEVLLWEEVEIP